MSYTNFNMRLDDKLRSSAYPIFEEYGLTPSQAVRMFFNQVGKTGKIPLSFDWAESCSLSHIPNQKTLESLQQGREDYLAGKLSSYKIENSKEITQTLLDIANDQ